MNRLASEKSPYLLQHAHNPVDWYPWGDTAFERSHVEGKPIFLSVGYSTCHWCHVMAHESFEDEAIARVLNEDFVCVKVDREERPDVDRVYMLFVQATTGGGGWPMSVWLTPDLEPFYGGTYFPPTARWGRPGFIDILQDIARVWREDPAKVRASAAQVTGRMREFSRARGARPRGGTAISPDVLERAAEDFGRDFDHTHGGFGGAPKFPRPSELFFLLREFARRGDTSARDMAVATLRAMAQGGIHDHLGGGFHRYSVDAGWHVPHFEKMLYDQGQLALAFLEAWQVTHDTEFADAAAGILRYVSRDLGRAAGGFHSAEDADSTPHDQAEKPDAHAAEGAFYVWTDAEFGEVLGEDAPIASLRFGVRRDGNVASDPHGEFAGKNVLYLARSAIEIATATGRSASDVRQHLAGATVRLFEARSHRPRPGLDDKVIVAWNGLMIAAFARAGRVFADRAFMRVAREAAAFIQENMWDEPRGRLFRRYRDGEAAIDAYAEDFACLIFGLLELFQADGDAGWLSWAIALQQRQDHLFEDREAGGWFSTTGEDGSVLLRLKEDYDGAEPSASSMSLWNLLTLVRLTGEQALVARIERAIGAFEAQIVQAPRAVPMLLAALSTWFAAGQEIVIAGRRDSEDTKRLHAALAAQYLPFAVFVPLSPDNQVSRILPFVEALTMRGEMATAYVCREFACSQPTTDAQEMLSQLETPR